MKRLLIPSFFFLFSGSSFCQTVLKMPVYKNSFSVEFLYPPGYVSELFSSNGYFQFPAFTLTGEFRIKNKFYGEFGFMPFGKDISSISNWDYENYNSTRLRYAAYAGGLMKFRIVNNFYFAPSLDLFFFQSKYIYEYPTIYSYNYLYFGLGGSLGFEYFLSKRFSLNTDILSMSYGLRYNTHPNPGSNHIQGPYLAEHGYLGLYKVLSLGIHYNFNWKK